MVGWVEGLEDSFMDYESFVFVRVYVEYSTQRLLRSGL